MLLYSYSTCPFFAECHDFLLVVDNVMYRATRRAHISFIF